MSASEPPGPRAERTSVRGRYGVKLVGGMTRAPITPPDTRLIVEDSLTHVYPELAHVSEIKSVPSSAVWSTSTDRGIERALSRVILDGVCIHTHYRRER